MMYYSPMALTGNGAVSPKQFFATSFDSGEYLLRSSALSSVSNGNEGIFSAWVNISSSTTGNFVSIFDISDPAVSALEGTVVIYKWDSGGSTPDGILVRLRRDTNNSLISFSTTPNPITFDVWNHILVSWDTGNSYLKVYINDIDETDATFGATGTVDYEDTSIAVGVDAVNQNLHRFAGCMSEMYFNTDTYLDITVTENRRKFISSGGSPVPLGESGQLPTGQQPAIYFPFNPLAPGTNAGYGGAFNVTGTLSACSSKP